MKSVLLLSILAGSTMPLGAAAARWLHLHPRWLESELRHGVVAFGGGVLIAAVALVLIPEGISRLSPLAVSLSFSAGGLFFFFVDRAISRSGLKVSQLLAMLLDFIPESVALGAMLATGGAGGLVLALLIALQNFPEGYNAYLEFRAAGRLQPNIILSAFAALVLLGPAAATFGYVFLFEAHAALGSIMCFAAAGILYLTFQDIAPQSHTRNRWAPALGAVGGFLTGLLGQMILSG